MNVLWQSNAGRAGHPLDLVSASPSGRYLFLNHSNLPQGPAVQLFDTARRSLVDYQLVFDDNYLPVGGRVFFVFAVSNTDTLLSFFSPPNSVFLAYASLDHNLHRLVVTGLADQWVNDPNRLLIGACQFRADVFLLYSTADPDEDLADHDEHLLYRVEVKRRRLTVRSLTDFPAAESVCPMAASDRCLLWMLPIQNNSNQRILCCLDLATSQFHWFPTMGQQNSSVTGCDLSMQLSGGALWLKSRNGVALWKLDLRWVSWNRHALINFDPFYTYFTTDSHGYGYFYRPQTAIQHQKAFICRVFLNGVPRLQQMAFHALLGAVPSVEAAIQNLPNHLIAALL